MLKLSIYAKKNKPQIIEKILRKNEFGNLAETLLKTK